MSSALRMRLPLAGKSGIRWPGFSARPNSIALCAALLGLLSLQWPFVVLRLNRVMPLGDDYSLFALNPGWGGLAAGAWLLFGVSAVLAPGKLRKAALALALSIAAGACFAALTWGALHLTADNEFSRVGIGAGAWSSLAALYIALFALHAEAPLWLPAPLLVLAALAGAAPYRHLGIVLEYREVADVFQQEFLRHILLVGAALPLVILAGAAIGVLAVRKPACEGVLLSVTGFLQTVPSIALFGLLLPLLSVYGRQVTVAGALLFALALLVLTGAGWLLLKRWPQPLLLTVYGVVIALGLLVLLPVFGLTVYQLMADGAAFIASLHASATLAELGLRGLGAAPAIVALVLYGIWPIVVHTHAGLGSVPAAILEAARGMGMSSRQIFWRVELPLAAPFLVQGVRGALLLLIGLTTVAVLVNAGGLGFFLLRGTEQSVSDLVLLGSLPVVALAFGADALTRLLAWALTPRGAWR
ncbi:ABC transporter permease [Janthinobacterium agaricidamnosum]|uniref:Binding--dependent transport system inner membrane component family protein n=1 Tax=Janthinobacterium agaricidamnosum NBRC 102515 = DSM 9628 TaxID=1349767 RepID=W0V536_9BURK|nr:ABC transporter permease [Janthinobacterium agaricidamnosum]CDG82392.1 binding--dependent transport system inner membrane component family protein [Janthinobacterium agaricidamnosum NBRC 102515 = DSM 9628]